MLHKLCVILAAILIVAALASPAMATPYTFDEDTGDWDVAGNWFPEEGAPPGAGDTATILDGQVCTIDTAEAAHQLTIEDGGKVILTAGHDLTLGTTLMTGDSLVIEDGGTLEIQGGSTNSEPELSLYGEVNITGDSAITFAGGGANAYITLLGNVTIEGSSTITGVCGSAINNKGTQIRHGGKNLTISDGITYKNIGSNLGSGDNINNGIIEVSCGGADLSEFLNDGQNYGTGEWRILSGIMRTDDDHTEWTTPGSAGKFIIDGGSWSFAGTCIDFSDELEFREGGFGFRDEDGITFRNCGNFTFGQDAASQMYFLFEENTFEVGGTCE